MSEITFDNFFTSTIATFKGCKAPNREADYTSRSRDGSISSLYWYGEDNHGQYVIRASDHWVMEYGFKNNDKYHHCDRIATCLWNFKSNKKSGIRVERFQIFYAGKCYLKNFKNR